MEKVLIDTFNVPEKSVAEFREAAHKRHNFIRTIPGYVQGDVFEKSDGESRYNFITTAVWESEEAFENAKKAVALENERTGYDPQANAKRLGVESVRSTYERLPPDRAVGVR